MKIVLVTKHILRPRNPPFYIAEVLTVSKVDFEVFERQAGACGIHLARAVVASDPGDPLRFIARRQGSVRESLSIELGDLVGLAIDEAIPHDGFEEIVGIPSLELLASVEQPRWRRGLELVSENSMFVL